MEDHGDPVADENGASPERALNRVEAGRRLWAGLARLSLEQRTALVLRELHGMSYVEVGYALGVTTSAVKSRLSRARETLRRELTL